MSIDPIRFRRDQVFRTYTTAYLLKQRPHTLPGAAVSALDRVMPEALDRFFNLHLSEQLVLIQDPGRLGQRLATLIINEWDRAAVHGTTCFGEVLAPQLDLLFGSLFFPQTTEDEIKAAEQSVDMIEDILAEDKANESQNTRR